jgi:hypothetical protein
MSLYAILLSPSNLVLVSPSCSPMEGGPVQGSNTGEEAVHILMHVISSSSKVSGHTRRVDFVLHCCGSRTVDKRKVSSVKCNLS